MSLKMFYDNLIDFLKQNNSYWENVYLINSLLENREGFTYRYNLDEDDNINGFIGIWEDEKVVTMTGNMHYCNNFFKDNIKDYKFYDINSDLSHYLISKCNHHNKPVKTLEYEVMALDGDKKYCEYKEVDLDVLSYDEWKKIRDIYKSKYEIEFTDYDDGRMKWYSVKDKNGKVMTNLCIENGHDDVLVLSNFYTSPEYKGSGVGKNFFKQLVSSFDKKLVLFVEKGNEVSEFYKELGFNRVASTWSFEI